MYIAFAKIEVKRLTFRTAMFLGSGVPSFPQDYMTLRRFSAHMYAVLGLGQDMMYGPILYGSFWFLRLSYRNKGAPERKQASKRRD